MVNKRVLAVFFLLILFTLFLMGCQQGVTGRVAGDADTSRYQQLLDCQNQGRSLTECRKASTITPGEYEALK